MSESTFEPGEVLGSAQTFFRTASGTRVHLPQCPHLVETDAHRVTAAERLAHPVCDWSQAQLGGFGREHFDDLEGALRRIGVPVEAHDVVLHALRFVDHDEVFVVHSLTYGALARDGRTVAGFGKTYYWVGDRRVNLPTYVEGTRAGHTRDGAHGAVCPVHFVEMSLTGVCDDC
jgi:hypothetical protein